MRVIFYSSDEQLTKLVEVLENDIVLLSDSEEQILEWMEEVPEGDNLYLIIDFDENQKAREKFSSSLIKNEWIFRFVASANLSLKDLKKHQKGKSAAHAYLRKPFRIAQLEEAINEIELALHLENDPESDGSDFKKISLSGTKSFKMTSSKNLVHEPTEERDLEEFKVSTEVRKIVEAHSSNAHALQNSEINKRIQAKFDFVFGEGADQYIEKSKNTSMELPSWGEEQADQQGREAGADIEIEEKDIILELLEGDENVSGEDLEVQLDEDSIELSEESEDEIELTEEDEVVIEDESEEDSIKIEEESNEEEIEELSFDDSSDEDEVILDGSDEQASEEETLEAGSSQEEQIQLPDEEDLALPDINPQPKKKEAPMTSKKDKTGELSFDEESELESNDLEFSSAPDEIEEETDDDALEFSDSEESSSESAADQGVDLTVDAGDDDGLVLGDDSVETAGAGASVDQGMDLNLDDSDGLEMGEVETNSGGGEELDLGNVEASEDSEEDAGLDLGEEQEDALDLSGEDELKAEDVEITSDDFDENSGELNLGSMEGGEEVVITEEEVHNENTGSFSDDELLSAMDDDEEVDSTVIMTKPPMAPNLSDLGDEEEVEIEEEVINENTGEFDDLLDEDDEQNLDDMTMVMSPKEIETNETKTITKTTSKTSKKSTPSERERVPKSGQMSFSGGVSDHAPTYVNEGELVRLQATIRQLREEREKLLAEIKTLKVQNKELEQENIGLRAEVDDVKVEVTIIKRRHADEVDELKYRLKLSEEKRLVAEERNKSAQKEIDRLEGKVRLDITQIKQREKELEAKLELVTMDSDAQVKTRDMKILELKRKIDQLEFNMENAIIREQKSREDKLKLEDRLQRMMKTLRGSIQLLEDDMSGEAINGLKKNELKE